MFVYTRIQLHLLPLYYVCECVPGPWGWKSFHECSQLLLVHMSKLNTIAMASRLFLCCSSALWYRSPVTQWWELPGFGSESQLFELWDHTSLEAFVRSDSWIFRVTMSCYIFWCTGENQRSIEQPEWQFEQARRVACCKDAPVFTIWGLVGLSGLNKLAFATIKAFLIFLLRFTLTLLHFNIEFLIDWVVWRQIIYFWYAK